MQSLDLLAQVLKQNIRRWPDRLNILESRRMVNRLLKFIDLLPNFGLVMKELRVTDFRERVDQLSVASRNMQAMQLTFPDPPRSLVAHPICAVPEAWRVAVSWTSAAKRDVINFRFELPRHGLRFPSASGKSPMRVDGLWQHTCVELFFAAPGSVAYREFNFATNGDWAAYDFIDYRQMAARLPQIPPPRVVTNIADDVCLVSVELGAGCLPDVAEARFSATAVLESNSGERSYWAAHHPGAQPDFHHRDGFVLTLD